METIIPINYAPNTVLVHENIAVFVNIGGQNVNQYITGKSIPIQKLYSLNDKSRELIISKLN